MAYLIFNFDLKAYDINRADWIDPHPGSDAWMAGPNVFISRTDLARVASKPIEEQKIILSRMIRFDQEDIEAFEKEHKELVSSLQYTNQKETSSPSQSSVVSQVIMNPQSSLPSTSFPAQEKQTSNFTNSDDYRKCWLNGHKYELTQNQAKIVKILHEAKGDAIHQKSILEKMKLPYRTRFFLGDFFRDTSHKKTYCSAWNTLVVRTRPGWYRLNL